MTDEVTRSAANHALLNYRQADNEGIMVEVSRQAIHMVDDEVADLRAKLVTYKSEVAEHIVNRREWANCIVPDLDGMSSDWIDGYLWAMSELEERFSLADIRALSTKREEG